MKCEKCNSELREGTKFCPECGSAVEPSEQAAPAAQVKPIFCTECGAKNAPSQKFCCECGAALGEAVTPPKQAAHKSKPKRKSAPPKLAIIIATAVVALAGLSLLIFTVVVPSANYNKAQELFAAGDTLGALEKYRAAGSYKDSVVKLIECSSALRGKIAVTFIDVLGVRSDGTIIAGMPGDDWYVFDFSGWTDIAAVSVGWSHIVGLKRDGTVVVMGDESEGQSDVGGWTDIIAVSAGAFQTVALRADGTVVASGYDYDYDGSSDVSGWTDIVAVSAGGYHAVGLKRDGTVVATGKNLEGECNVSGWNDIVAISAGTYHTVGLRADGTVVAAGANESNQCDVSGWSDIIAVSAAMFSDDTYGAGCTIGLKRDGTVIATGDNEYGQCDVSGWTDIVAVSGSELFTAGLKSDGSVVSTLSPDNKALINIFDEEDMKTVTDFSNILKSWDLF